MTEKETAEAIINKHLTIIAEENMSSDEILLYTAKNCARSEVQAIIEALGYLNKKPNVAILFWKGVFEEIK